MPQSLIWAILTPGMLYLSLHEMLFPSYDEEFFKGYNQLIFVNMRHQTNSYMTLTKIFQVVFQNE